LAANIFDYCYLFTTATPPNQWRFVSQADLFPSFSGHVLFPGVRQSQNV
jgi:hypothetical protein